MLIDKQPNGWSISSEEQNGLWHLVFDDQKNVLSYFESVLQTSTGANLFVGSKQECDQYIIDNELIKADIQETPEEINLLEEINN